MISDIAPSPYLTSSMESITNSPNSTNRKRKSQPGRTTSPTDILKKKKERANSSSSFNCQSLEFLQVPARRGLDKKEKLADLAQSALHRFCEEKHKSSQIFNFDILIESPNEEYPVPVMVGVAHTRGVKRFMEDRHIVVDSLHDKENDSISPASFCGVYDGHNGELAAKHATERLHKILAKDILAQEISSGLRGYLQSHSSIMNAITRAYSKTDEEILEATPKDGTTALTSLIIGNHIYIANVGDTRAVIARYEDKLEVERVSIDHKPNLREEKKRIEESGGEVVFSGCWRVSHKNVPLRLAVSRALGDSSLKLDLPKPLVSAQPYIAAIPLTKSIRFLVLASDGIWDRITDVEVAEMVNIGLLNSKGEYSPTPSAVKAAADNLVEVALLRKSFDNATAMVIAFQWNT